MLCNLLQKYIFTRADIYPSLCSCTVWMKLKAVKAEAWLQYYWAVMKPVPGLNECTWMEVQLRASPAPRDEACRRCAISFQRWIVLSQWREAEITVMQEPRRDIWVTLALLHVERWERRAWKASCDGCEGQRGCVVSHYSVAAWLDRPVDAVCQEACAF